MILEKMPTGKLKSLRAEVEAMIATKVAERRQELQSQLSKQKVPLVAYESAYGILLQPLS